MKPLQIMDIIGGLFAICVGIMIGVGNLLHVSYDTINVVMFCFVEPIFTGLMIVLAILALCKAPVSKLGIWFFRILVGIVVPLFLAGGLYFLGEGLLFIQMRVGEPLRSLSFETPRHLESLFDGTVSWLEGLGDELHMSYEAINIIIYVLLMPVLCIASYVILRVTNKRK